MPSGIKSIDFVRDVFKSRDTVSYRALCEEVWKNKEKIVDFPNDYKHRVREILWHLKNAQHEIELVQRGVYKRKRSPKND